MDINYLKQTDNIQVIGNVFIFNLNFENLYTDLEFLETNLQLIPFDIYLNRSDNTIGRKNVIFVFIKKDIMKDSLDEIKDSLYRDNVIFSNEYSLSEVYDLIYDNL